MLWREPTYEVLFAALDDLIFAKGETTEIAMVRDLIGIAVVGYGYWGPNLVRNFANIDGAELIAVSELDEAKLAIAKRRHPAIVSTSDYRELLTNSKIDAIAIATPVQTHYDLALKALRAGKHVFVEKPLAQTTHQVRHLIEEAAKRNLVLLVDHTFLYTPAVQKIRELIAEGELGDIYYYNGIRASLGLFQTDVNVIWDLAVHDVSIMQFILNEKPVAVSATGAYHVVGSPANMAHITLFFPSSCIAHVNVNWLSPVKIRQTLIGGSRKMIVYDDLEATEKIKLYDKGITVGRAEEDAHQFRIGYRAGDMWAPHLTVKEALEIEAEHFIDCIRTGATPISSGATGLQVVEILEAASRSIAARGSPIPIEATSGVRGSAPINSGHLRK
jgi:predicted dehydrogenase